MRCVIRVNQLITHGFRPYIPGCPVPTVPGCPEVFAVPNPGTRVHFVPGFGTNSNYINNLTNYPEILKRTFA